MSQELNVLIVEDDVSFSLELEMLVDEIGYNVLAVVDNSAEALEVIYADQPDLILMDIDIKGKLSGLDIAKKITALKIPIIFITSYKDEETYEESQKTTAIGYLVKPIQKITLKTSIELALRTLSQTEDDGESVTEQKAVTQEPVMATPAGVPQGNEDFILKRSFFLKKNNLLIKVPFNEIQYVKSSGDYCVIHTENGKFVPKITMSKMEKSLSKDQFIRVHKSFLISIRGIEQIALTQNRVFVAGESIPVGRAYKKDLVSKLNLLE